MFSFLGNTEVLAIIGAISGVLGTLLGCGNFYLRFSQQRKDRAKLRCRLVFQEPKNSGIALRVVNVEIRSIGCRPINLDYLELCHSKEGLIGNVQARWHWLRGEWKTNYPISPEKKRLTENSKTVCIISSERVDLSTVKRIFVVDEVGNRWKVATSNVSGLLSKYQKTKINSLSYSGRHLEYDVDAYSLGKCFFINIRWKHDGVPKSTKSKLLKFRSAKDLDQKFRELETSILPRYLNGEGMNGL